MTKNKFFPLSVFIVGLFVALSANAQEAMIDKPIVKLQALDKSTARTTTFQAKVGSTIQQGSLFIKTQACRKAQPLEKPESAAFLQVWEVPVGQEKSQWIFSGWMFASSPALSAMDHPVYDVWVLDCLDEEKPEDESTQDGAPEGQPSEDAPEQEAVLQEAQDDEPQESKSEIDAILDAAIE